MSIPVSACDALVIGGGPAGISAALAASGAGAKVVLIDENHDGGGQVYRPLPAAFARSRQPTVEERDGDALREALASSAVERRFGHRVWNVGPGFRVDAVGADGPIAWTAGALIAATGAHERVVPFPGWTEPGVIGLAAATVLLKSQRMLPGRSTVVAGCGPLLLAVAAGILKAGGEVVAVVDLAARGEWLRRIPRLAARTDLILRGASWLAALRRAGVPLLSRHAVRQVEGAGGTLEIRVGAVDADGAPVPGPGRTLRADSLAVGNGLAPGNEITRVLRAEHDYAASHGGWVPRVRDGCRTSVAGLYVAGDGAGIAGAAAAVHHGTLAGLAAAHQLGCIDDAAFAAARAVTEPSLARARRFGAAMSELMALRPAQVAAITADTTVCRCEDVTRAEIDAALDTGARDVNQVKAWTRCGMGPCQGRTCGDVIGQLVAQRIGSREEASFFTGRPPLRPISLGQLTGAYEYADIPIPKAAPL